MTAPALTAVRCSRWLKCRRGELVTCEHADHHAPQAIDAALVGAHGLKVVPWCSETERFCGWSGQPVRCEGEGER